MASRHFIKGFPWKVFYRFVVVQSVVAVLGLAAAGVGARYFFKRQFIRQVRSQVQDALRHLSLETTKPSAGWCQKARGTELRFSILNGDGALICDSQANTALEPFETFKEVQIARRGEYGQDIRYDDRVGGYVLYGAERLGAEDTVVRVALPLTRLSETMAMFDTTLIIVMLLVAGVMVLLAFWSARRLVFPLGRLLLKTQTLLGIQPEVVHDEDFTEEAFDEWLELETNIDSMRKDLAAKTQSLSMEQVELDTIMGAISDAILAVDPEGNPLFFNSRFELQFGGDGLRKRNIKLWGIFRDPEILSAFTSALRDGKVAATKAIPLELKGGLRNYFSLSVSPLRKQDGSIYGAVGIFHDVTQLKSAEQMRIDFVANVSHELRTPLTSIKGYVDTLIDDVKEKRKVDGDFLAIISRNSDRLMNLMNDLLDLSAIESDDILQKDPVDTKDLTSKIVGQLQSRIDGKSQKIAVDFPASTVIADPQRVEQVVVNLLDNAIKYTPPGGNLRVEWSPDGNDVVLKVWNDGPAIPIEHHPRLFERFYRVDKARSREQGGTGLGLAIVKHIMQKHEGTVWVESKAGKGTTFFCRFPSPA